MTLYRKPQPYRKPRTYRGAELVPAVAAPGFSAALALPYAQATSRASVVRVEWEQAAANEAVTRAAYGAQAPEERASRLAWRGAASHEANGRLRWDAIAPAEAITVVPWGAPAPREGAVALPWAETSVRDESGPALAWGVSTPREARYRLPWGHLSAREFASSAVWRAVRARGAYVALPWGPAGKRERDYGIPWPVEPNPGGPGADPITVPIQPVYVMLPTLSAVVLPLRTPLELLSASVATDAGNWCWRLQAQIPIVELPKVNRALATDPVEIEVSINGYVWTFYVESHSDNRRFGSRTATIQGRSRSAVLAEPTAPVTSRIAADDRNASQLADEELFGTGWTLLWDAVDWLVPGGTFSYTDLAPIDAIGQLAGAIGARVESHRANLELAVKPTHPISPWEWDSATPYAILPAEICTVFDGNWQGGSNANGIYVYAQNSSFGALVRVTGTGGEVQLPMVVDQLLVSADPARERGRAELARASRVKGERVVLPLFPSPADPGLIPVGELIQVDESATDSWLGQVMGVQVTASRNGSALSVRQQLDVERHFR